MLFRSVVPVVMVVMGLPAPMVLVVKVHWFLIFRLACFRLWCPVPVVEVVKVVKVVDGIPPANLASRVLRQR